jgi:tetratricopeptide (TPR) repeat protein
MAALTRKAMAPTPDDNGSPGVVHHSVAPSRGELLERLENIVASTEGDSESEERELRRLIAAIKNSTGTFSLRFAVCNDINLRRRLSGEIMSRLKDMRPSELVLTGSERSLVDALRAAAGKPAPLIVHNLEILLPSDRSRASEARRDLTLTELQHRREQFRSLGRPIIFWMSDYVYSLIGQRAVDFWSWQSGAIRFGHAPLSRIGRAYDAPLGALRRTEFDLPAVNSLPGREELDKLATYAESAKEQGRPILVYGPWGAGKSSIVRQFAKSHVDEFRDGVYFQSLEGRSLDEALREAISNISSLSRDREERTPGLVSTYRHLTSGVHSLIVFDDVDSSQIEPSELAQLVPERPALAVFIGRRKFELPDALEIEVGGLSPEAEQLLSHLIDQAGASRAQLARLVEYSEGSRLALSLLVELIRRGSIKSIDDPEASLSSLRVELGRRLDDESPTYVARLRGFTIFPGDFDRSAGVQIVWDRDDKVAEQEFDRLVENGWLKSMGQAERYALAHTLIRDLLGKQESPVREEVGERFSTYYATKLYSFEARWRAQRGAASDTLSWIDREKRNLIAGQAWAASNADKSPMAKQLAIAYALAGPTLMRRSLDQDTQQVWLSTGLKYGTPEQRGELALLLSNLLIDVGRDEDALGLLRGVISIPEMRRSAVATGALLQLGRICARMGSLDEAVEYLKDQLSEMERTGGDERIRAETYGELADVAMQARDFSTAEMWLHRQLSLAERLQDRMLNTSSLANLARLKVQAGELDEGERLLRMALDHASLLGNVGLEIRLLYDLGEVYGRKENFEAARQVFERMHAQASKVDDIRGISLSLRNLGDVALKVGDARRAIPLLERSLHAAESSHDRTSIANNLFSLARGYESIGDFGEARRVLERANTTFAEIGDAVGQAIVRLRLAFLSLKNGEIDLASEQFEQSQKLFEGLNRPHGVARAKYGLAQIARLRGHEHEAKTLEYEADSILQSSDAD